MSCSLCLTVKYLLCLFHSCWNQDMHIVQDIQNMHITLDISLKKDSRNYQLVRNVVLRTDVFFQTVTDFYFMLYESKLCREPFQGRAMTIFSKIPKKGNKKERQRLLNISALTNSTSGQRTSQPNVPQLSDYMESFPFLVYVPPDTNCLRGKPAYKVM